MPKHRRNPAPPPPPRRPGPPSNQRVSTSLARVRQIAKSLPERERPFDPSRRGSWQGSSRDLVVNGSVNGVKLDAFTVAFLEAALFTSTDESRDDGGDPLDDNYSITDFDRASLQLAKEDCERFQEENADAIDQGPGVDSYSDAGHDYWLTRNGHGAGFWDGDWPEPAASQLTEASKRAGQAYVFVADDGSLDLTIERAQRRNGHRRNGEQTHFPFGSKRAGRLEIPAVDFDWEQIDGDVNLPTYGGIIARCDGGTIDLVEIQPVREYVGDGEAAEVGFPFWTKEASFHVDDLDPSDSQVRAALQSSDLDLDDVDPDFRMRAIAVALMRYGHAEEGDGGWAGDKQPGEVGRGNLLGSRKVRWSYAGSKRTTFAEEAGDEDDEFRREVLGEEEDD